MAPRRVASSVVVAAADNDNDQPHETASLDAAFVAIVDTSFITAAAVDDDGDSDHATRVSATTLISANS
ncbi:hypothetical protein M422DRAFT_262426 [Sphaerobolus stellatus SS14]|uniref:Uncharacterized protein n=1 Tax=Sphaerobolus stellatus (strain SS14) TaxID=990650 RepID=A0A0C9VCL2_SPHS4|nr:hypothetical protein M422DRAFT_262424 [Sphaerobolus stellatus SS14]KIJ35260.1 hypothetical protein M422DRAFT_262426 [Sphaerobolus stellatus SS14]